MKKTYIICFLGLAVLFSATYYASYRYALDHLKSDNISEISDLSAKNPALTDDTVAAVDSVNEDVITKNTIYILESYNLTDDSITKETLEVPIEFLGMTRDDLILYLQKYMDNLSQSEKNIVNFQLISFSESNIVLRKSFNDNLDEYKYWLTDVDGTIVVYKADKQTVYINTTIKTENLPEDEQEKVKQGRYIQSIHELYDYLESYTS